MKKIIFLIVLMVGSIRLAMADDVVTRDVNQLPLAARELIDKQFSHRKVDFIKIERDLFEETTYEVKLDDGTELEFNSKGGWVEIDAKKDDVPSEFIPQSIQEYMKDHYKGEKIVKIERDRKGYELTLENGLEVNFDQFGKFLKLSN